jgi:hypothetical protein
MTYDTRKGIFIHVESLLGRMQIDYKETKKKTEKINGEIRKIEEVVGTYQRQIDRLKRDLRVLDDKLDDIAAYAVEYQRLPAGMAEDEEAQANYVPPENPDPDFEREEFAKGKITQILSNGPLSYDNLIIELSADENLKDLDGFIIKKSLYRMRELGEVSDKANEWTLIPLNQMKITATRKNAKHLASSNTDSTTLLSVAGEAAVLAGTAED